MRRFARRRGGVALGFCLTLIVAVPDLVGAMAQTRALSPGEQLARMICSESRNPEAEVVALPPVTNVGAAERPSGAIATLAEYCGRGSGIRVLGVLPRQLQRQFLVGRWFFIESRRSGEHGWIDTSLERGRFVQACGTDYETNQIPAKVRPMCDAVFGLRGVLEFDPNPKARKRAAKRAQEALRELPELGPEPIAVEGTPDLFFSTPEIYVPQVGDACTPELAPVVTVTVEIGNRGTAAAPAVVEVAVFDTNGTLLIVRGLEPGESIPFVPHTLDLADTSFLDTSDIGRLVIQPAQGGSLAIDPANKIPELDDANNRIDVPDPAALTCEGP